MFKGEAKSFVKVLLLIVGLPLLLGLLTVVVLAILQRLG